MTPVGILHKSDGVPCRGMRRGNDDMFNIMRFLSQMLRQAAFVILLLYELRGLQCPVLNWASIVGYFLVWSFSEFLIGEDHHPTLHSFLDNLAWSVSFLSFAILIGNTVLRCLVNIVSFLRLLGVSIVEVPDSFCMPVIDTVHLVTASDDHQSLVLFILNVFVVCGA